MDKILSINTIKNVFAALGAKTSDSNYGVALLDKTSGEPKGLMGMSDLASVLGGNYIPKAYGRLSELADSITYNSVFFNYGTSGLNTPSSYGILVTLRAGSTNYGYWGLQLFFSVSSAILWKRVGNSGSDEWGEWVQIGE